MDNPNTAEDLGYAFLQKVVSLGNGIWRRQSEKDVGVDGYIEVLRSNGSSAIIAVQVKAGRSYFQNFQSDGRARIRSALGVKKLKQLGKMNLPAIIVVYDPAGDRGYWEHITYFLEDNPESLSSGKIPDLIWKDFSAETLDLFRTDLRVVRTPHLSSSEIREFLSLSRDFSPTTFLPLAQSVLNGYVILGTLHTRALRFWEASGLMQDVPGGSPQGRILRPTQKGERYVKFLLGGRYLVPPEIFSKKEDISEMDLYFTVYGRQFFETTGKISGDHH